MMDVTRGVRGELVIRVEGVFDRQAASRLSGWLGEIPVSAPLVLDFSGVREVQDLGVAAMAGQLCGRDAVEVVGLGRHQQRLLRYLGVTLAPPADDEEALG
jgi:hypothetical protein